MLNRDPKHRLDQAKYVLLLSIFYLKETLYVMMINDHN